MFACISSSIRKPSTISLLVACMVSMALGTADRASAQLSVTGKWDKVSASVWPQGGEATHLVVLRGNKDSTRVLYFHDQKEPRLWLRSPTGAGPDLTSPTVQVRETDGDRLFCAGQLVLPDGRALVAGGTTHGETGTAMAKLFDAKNYGAGNNYGWSVQDSLKFGRWYPSVTLLGSGKSLITSGHSHYNMLALGGRDSVGRLKQGSWSGPSGRWHEFGGAATT